MDLIVNQVMELQIVGIADRDQVIEGLAGTAVIQDGLAVRALSGLHQQLLDILLGSAVKHGSGHVPAQRLGGHAQVHLQHLAQVHTGGNAQRVQNNLQGRAIRHKGHILLAQNAAYNALVAVTASHLVAHADLALLSNVDANHFIHAGR